MAADDKLRLKIAAKRIETWKEYKLQPPKVVKRCRSVLFAPGQDKPEVVHTDKDTIETNLLVEAQSKHGSARYAKLKLGSAETNMRLDSRDRNQDGCATDGNGYEYGHPGNVPAHLQDAPKYAKPHKSSVFKKERRVPVIRHKLKLVNKD